MNKLPLALCLILILVTPAVKSQDKNKVDSLEHQLKSHRNNDTTKVNLWNEIAFAVHGADRDKSLDYSKHAVNLAIKINYKKGIAKSLSALGYAYDETNIKLAIEYATKGLKVAEIIHSDTEIADCSSILGDIYYSLDRNKALQYILRSIHLAEKTNDQKSIARFMSRLGMYYIKNGEFDRSVSTNLKALKIAELIGDKAIEATCVHLLGMVQSFQGKYPQALEYSLRYLSLMETKNNKMNTFSALNEIGSIYSVLNDYAKADYYQQRALKMACELKDKRSVFISYNNIGLNYGKKHDPKAIEYHEKALKVATEMNDTMLITGSLRSLAPLYVQQGKIDLALGFYKKALKTSSNNFVDSGIYFEIGHAYLLQKKYAASLHYTLIALDLENKLNLMDKMNIHKQLSEIYVATNNFPKAYYHQKRFVEIKDSVYNAKNTKRIAELEYNYKLEKEKHLIELKQQKKDTVHKLIVISLVVGLLLLSLFAVYVYRSLRIKRKTNLLLTEKNDKIEKLINFKDWMLNIIIHDLKNPINRILNAGNKPVIQNDEVVEPAKQMLLLVQNILDVYKIEESKMSLKLSMLHFDRIIQQATEQVTYLLDEKKITLIKRLSVKSILEVDEHLLVRVIINLLSNAIKYSKANSHIEIRIMPKECKIRVEVIDNGDGIETANLDAIFEKYFQENTKNLGYNHSTGLGLSFCKSIISLHGGTIGAQSVVNQGTTIWFELPVKSENVAINEEITQTSPKKYKNSQHEGEIILKYKIKMANLVVYQTGEILNILKSSTSEDLPDFLFWKEEIVKSAMTGNVEYFNQLKEIPSDLNSASLIAQG